MSKLVKPSTSSASEVNSNASLAARILRGTGEAVLLILVVISPWPFASNEPPFESALAGGVLLLTALWAAHAALTSRFVFMFDIVSLCLLGLVLWSGIQLIPLPEFIVGVISPERLEWHQTLLPEQAEVLPGETEAVTRPSILPLSIDPSATYTFLMRVLGLLLIYLAARNWLATRASFSRLAWVLAGTGVALAIFALGQLVSSTSNFVYWSVQVEGSVFGPFICRNHYPAYMALCAGMALGLLIPRAARPKGAEGLSAAHEQIASALFSLRGLGLAAAAGLMIVSIAFSMSRSGFLAVVFAGIGSWLLSRVGRPARPSWVSWIAVGTVTLAGLAVASGFGTMIIEQRLATVAQRDAYDSRLPLWQDSIRLIPDFWLTGTGGGTYIWAEPLIRTDRSAGYFVEHAHSEYLEAIIEGGIIRLAITLALVIGLLGTVGHGFLKRSDRSVGPFILGAWFGLAAGVLHAVTEFGIHMPAVALMTAIVAGYAMAAATDREFIPTRLRVRRSKRTNETTITNSDSDDDNKLTSQPFVKEWTLRGWPASGASLIFVGLALLVALDARSRERSYRLKLAANLTYWETNTPYNLALRAKYLDARTTILPNDPVVLFDAAQGHIDAAVEATLASVADPNNPPDRFPSAVVDKHIIPALRYLREARAANPIAPKPHTRFALYAEYFAHAEPASIHFERAKQLLPTDPDLWYASGRYAFNHGNLPAAWSDWQRSLLLSDRHLKEILKAAHDKISSDELLEMVLPDDPVTLQLAMNRLYPDHDAQAHDRQLFLQATIEAAGRPDLNPAQLAAIAEAYDELLEPIAAEEAWRRALSLAPDDAIVRDAYSRWLEREERYEEAIEQLQWLQTHGRDGALITDRLDAVRHGLMLKQGIYEKK